jgi:hypothetical protein
MAKVTGIGGVFFKSKGDRAGVAAWYSKYLGMPLEQFGGAILKWPDDRGRGAQRPGIARERAVRVDRRSGREQGGVVGAEAPERQEQGRLRRVPSTDYRKAFVAITSDPRYLANLDWGEPRPGHPEGTVRAHIAELERNLQRLRRKLTDDEYWKLRLIIHTHDSFKAESQQGVAIADPRSHASLACAFLATHCDDADLLVMVQCHDEPFALYRQFEGEGEYSQDRFNTLLQAIRDWNLFLAFNIVDGCTVGKAREPLQWWFGEVAGKVASRFTSADIIA